MYLPFLVLVSGLGTGGRLDKQLKIQEVSAQSSWEGERAELLLQEASVNEGQRGAERGQDIKGLVGRVRVWVSTPRRVEHHYSFCSI